MSFLKNFQILHEITKFNENYFFRVTWTRPERYGGLFSNGAIWENAGVSPNHTILSAGEPLGEGQFSKSFGPPGPLETFFSRLPRTLKNSTFFDHHDFITSKIIKIERF